MNSLKVFPFRMGSGRRLSMMGTKARHQLQMTKACATPNSLFGTSCNCGIPEGKNKRKVRKSLFSSSLMSQDITSSFSSAAPQSNVQEGGQWDLYAGIVLERKPIVTQKPDEFQQKYKDMLANMEFEISKKSDHEVRHEDDVKMLEKVKAGEIDLGNVSTARDAEDQWNVELQNFNFASRETDADVKKDIRSLERALDSHLLLVVEQKLGNEHKWICPHSKVEAGENLRQAAERMLRENFPDMKTKILGNAPWGFYKYKYPKAVESAAGGGKVFFYKAQVISGAPTPVKGKKDSVIKDFVWLKRDELSGKLQEEYYKKLSECLIDE